MDLFPKVGFSFLCTATDSIFPIVATRWLSPNFCKPTAQPAEVEPAADFGVGTFIDGTERALRARFHKATAIIFFTFLLDAEKNSVRTNSQATGQPTYEQEKAMPTITTIESFGTLSQSAPAPRGPVRVTPDDDYEAGDEEFTYNDTREAMYVARAKRAFVPEALKYPPVLTECPNGYRILPDQSGKLVVMSGVYEYTPVRVGCGNEINDCSYCQETRGEFIRRLHKKNSHGVSSGICYTKLEEKIGRKLSAYEFSQLMAYTGSTTDMAELEKQFNAIWDRHKQSHTANEAHRLNALVRRFRVEGEASVRDRRKLDHNLRWKSQALTYAGKMGPDPVDVAIQRSVSEGLYNRKGALHGIPFLASKTWKRSKRLVGLEVEHNQPANLATWNAGWRGCVHADGSCGWEAVTTPLAGDNIEPCLVALTETLRKQSIRADSKCSVHVHVDASDVTWACMRRLLKVYSIVEPLLYVIGGQHRAFNRYCMPCGVAYSEAAKCADFKEAVLWVALSGGSRGMTGKELQRGRPQKKDGGRYRGLNIMPWAVGRKTRAPDTTIEFRIHRNSLDGKRLAGWAHLLASLVDFAVNSSDAEVNALPKSALRTLILACPTDKDWILKRVQSWRKATTCNPSATTDDAGGEKPIRRISAAKGWSVCAV